MNSQPSHPLMQPTALMMHQKSQDYLARNNANITAGNFHQMYPAQREGLLGAGIVQENQDEEIAFGEGNFLAVGPQIASNRSTCASANGMLAGD